MEREQILIGLMSSVAGGLLVAVLNILFTRRKISLEAEKLELEIKKLKAETDRLDNNVVKLNAAVREATEQKPVHRIGFDYREAESPESNDWKVVERVNDAEPVLTLVKDGFRGRVLQIRRLNRYALDYALNPSTGMGSSIEYVLKFEEGEACVYARVVVQSKNSSESAKLWLAFKPGSGPPREKRGLNPGEAEWEWSIPVTPERVGGRWLRFRVDLRDVVGHCLEDEGWQFAGQILTFRLRGSLSIAHITVFD